MEFVIYNSVEDVNHIREMISNKFLSITPTKKKNETNFL